MIERRLGIGTVQFGLDYGITNLDGQVGVDEAARILQAARESGLDVIDTAAAYGESERVLGSIKLSGLRIVTKTAPIRKQALAKDDLKNIHERFIQSLKDLCVNQVYALLVHHAEDLLVPGGEALYRQLLEWKTEGLVSKIGVSVYDGEQIARLFSRYEFDIVQLPLSVFDQRLLRNGSLATLKAAGVEIHARSIFLQGVLLTPSAALPPRLERLCTPLAAWQEHLLHEGLDPLQGALGFIKSLPEIDVALIGVLSTAHLLTCISAYDKAPLLRFEDLPDLPVQLIDPRLWN